MRTRNLKEAKAKQIRVLYIATLVLFLPMFVGIYFLYLEDKHTQEVVSPILYEEVSVNLNSVHVDAYSASVISLNTGKVLYEKNAEKQLPLASLTKIVTAKVANEAINTDTVEINKMNDFVEYGDSQLSQSEIWSKKDLIQYTLMTSSNDGAHSLAKQIPSSKSFTENMNGLVASIGLSNTHFYNETGLDNDSKGIIASKGTASDVSKILSYVLKTDLPLYEKTQHTTSNFSTNTGIKHATNTNDTVEQIPGMLISKTGYTDLAGGNLAVVVDMGLNEPTAFVVLKSSKESRFEDVIKLQEAYFEDIRERMR